MILHAYRGDSTAWEFTVRDALGQPQGISGSAIRFTAKANVDDDDDAALITATTGNGKVVITGTSTCEVRLTPADTNILPAPSTLLWDLQLREASGRVWTVAAGMLYVRPDISRTVP